MEIRKKINDLFNKASDESKKITVPKKLFLFSCLLYFSSIVLAVFDVFGIAYILVWLGTLTLFSTFLLN